MDVSVENADFRPHLRQGVCQVDRHGALTHAALAARDGDDVANVLRSAQCVLVLAGCLFVCLFACCCSLSLAR